MKKILIANRGEIATRVARTVREMGYQTVTVFSDADESSPHVRWGHEAYRLPGNSASETYLDVAKILAIAKSCGASAIHPGYGFLSENAAFSKACEKEGVVFVGASPQNISSMGDKIEARNLAKKAGVPTLSGTDAAKSLAEGKTHAGNIGYPVLLKAKAGGGGKGMRIVDSEKNFDEAFRLAASEAEKSFKDGSLYVEKYLEHARHVEVQIIADAHGNVFAVGDRDCSIQRRHQKVIEEAPAPNLKPETRKSMADAAMDLAKSVGYKGAGTLEFLVDEKERFYFLEMNTRLQVEHPVTEWISGLDLVALQIDAAFGDKLDLSGTMLRGHAIEVRLYAEDPDNGFFPAPGKLSTITWPTGPFTRVDTGVESGSTITLFYDPMVAKISVWAESRPLAIQRMLRALRETKIAGTKTNLGFLTNIVASSAFQKGTLSTQFIEAHGPFKPEKMTDEMLAATLAALAGEQRTTSTGNTSIPAQEVSNWWSSGIGRKT